MAVRICDLATGARLYSRTRPSATQAGKPVHTGKQWDTQYNGYLPATRPAHLKGIIIMPASLRSLLVASCLAAAVLSPAARAAQNADANSASELASLTGQLRIGSEFFLNRTETKASVENQFRLMRESGLTLVRIFVIWDDIERTPNNWNFEGYDWIYDAAAENRIKIVATLVRGRSAGMGEEDTLLPQPDEPQRSGNSHPRGDLHSEGC